jgi:hypothetical protein
MLEAVVAFAIASGILDQTKIESDVLDFLSRAIAMYEADEDD